MLSGWCIFHDKDYLQEKANHWKHNKKVFERLKHKVNQAISASKQLFCIGFHLHGFSLSYLSMSRKLNVPLYFYRASSLGVVYFSGADFKREALFTHVQFQRQANFFGANLLNYIKQTSLMLNSKDKLISLKLFQ